MSSAVAATATAGSASQGTARGRTRITSRALQRVVSAVTADALGVDTKDVDTDLSDNGGSLDLTVQAPITVPSISRVQDDSRAVDRSGGSVLQRCSAAEDGIRSRVRDITGSDIRRVTIRLTDIRIAERGRVR